VTVVAVAFGLVVVVVGLVGLANDEGARSGHKGAGPLASVTVLAQRPSAITVVPGPGLAWHAPPTVVSSGTPVQEQYDQAFSQGLSSLSGMSAAETLRVPAPAIAGGWPDLPVELTPEGWAEVFTDGLLNVDYAHQSRAALGAWLQAQESPELIPGVPLSVADKVLYVSLLDSGLFGGQPTPVAPVSQWPAKARARVRQRVSDVVVQSDPGWAQMIAAGWQPADVRMTEVDVSGVLSVQQGNSSTSQRFVLQLIVGSARWHDGYGTVAVADWQQR
jgi:hypothetical protein